MFRLVMTVLATPSLNAAWHRQSSGTKGTSTFTAPTNADRQLSSRITPNWRYCQEYLIAVAPGALHSRFSRREWSECIDYTDDRPLSGIFVQDRSWPMGVVPPDRPPFTFSYRLIRAATGSLRLFLCVPPSVSVAKQCSRAIFSRRLVARREDHA